MNIAHLYRHKYVEIIALKRLIKMPTDTLPFINVYHNDKKLYCPKCSCAKFKYITYYKRYICEECTTQIKKSQMMEYCLDDVINSFKKLNKKGKK
jgi:hypothetical protein